MGANKTDPTTRRTSPLSSGLTKLGCTPEGGSKPGTRLHSAGGGSCTADIEEEAQGDSGCIETPPNRKNLREMKISKRRSEIWTQRVGQNI